MDAKAHGETGDTTRPHRAGALDRLRSVVLLAGGVRETKLSSILPSSLLDLPLESNLTVLDQLMQQTDDLATHLGRESLDVRLLIGRLSKDFAVSPEASRSNVCVERDPFDYRGTGGVLRDIGTKYEEDDLVLVGNGSQVFVDPLRELAESLAADGGDVGVVAHRDGTPSGLMLVRCGCLKAIPASGFIDMKEQALPLIAQHHRVMVTMRDRPSTLPIRTLTDYLYALRLHHLRAKDQTALDDPFREDFEPTFGVVQEGADVDPSARVHDSVVLRGAKVAAGAILVRSLVSSGATVRRDQRIVDRLVGSPAMARRRQKNVEAADE
ncbi:MAG: hypothetical protein WD294_05375 [Phycisphaeraceae bacterium]